MKPTRGILLALLLHSSTLSYSQTITSIKASLDNINGAIDIAYTMEGAGKKRYKVEVYCSQDKGLTYSDALIGVSGEVGYNVKPGSNHIHWAYFVDMPDFTGKDIVFKVTAKEDVEYRENMILSLGGPEKFYQSILIPGYGNYHVRKGKGYFAITGIVVGLLGAGTYLHYESKGYYDDYLASTTSEMANSNFTKATNLRNTSNLLLGAGAAVWTIDVGQVIMKGLSNRKKQRDILKRRQR